MSSQYCYVQQSRIENAGLGLYANSLIPQSTVICRYRGKVLRTREAMRLNDKSYLMRLGEQVCLPLLPTPDMT